MLRFYLGTHKPGWLRWLGVPLFVSRRRLNDRKTVPRAVARWALDSGGFTELKLYGRWTIGPLEYARDVRRFMCEVGMMDWAACCDWMCEPAMLAKTGKSVAEHQALTIRSYLDLHSIDDALPIIPVLQGWHPDDYLRHVDEYAAAGVDLTALPVVGVGSVCRRQATAEAESIIRRVSSLGIRCHGFGMKQGGVVRSGDVLHSADSMAWSFAARYEPPLPGCKHPRCNNCPRFAMEWRRRLLEQLGAFRPEPTLFDEPVVRRPAARKIPA